MMARFAFQRYLYIMPKEADGGFDAANEMRGSGPWRLVEWEPSVGFTYERNEEWPVAPGQPYLDGLKATIIGEYAQRRVQLVAGNLWSDPGSASFSGLTAEDTLAVKKEEPRLAMYADAFPDTRPVFMNFGLLPDSPFHDVRVRRATSMVVDRDLYLDTAYNIPQFQSEGLPVVSNWHTHFAAGEPPYWIDPQGDGLGGASAYFQYNVDEARKMMEAAGVTEPLKMNAYVGPFGNTSQKEILHGMLNSSGLFDLQLSSIERTEYLPNYFNGGGEFEGIVLDNGPGASGDIDAHISVRFNVGAAPQVFYREVFPWYEKTQMLVEAQRTELDREKRLTILNDLQIEMADQMVAVPWPGIASGFSVAWPYLANYRTFTPRSIFTEQSESWPSFWYDASKDV
jgi:ABC-type transport system substrate-binding protein